MDSLKKKSIAQSCLQLSQKIKSALKRSLESDRKTKRSAVFFHKLDSQGIEVIFAPFHDPELASMIPFEVDTVPGVSLECKPFWCWTSICWKSCAVGDEIATLRCGVNKPIGTYTHIVLCLYAPQDSRMVVLLDFGNGAEPVTNEVLGTNSRQELLIPFRSHTDEDTVLHSVSIKFLSSGKGEKQVNLIWFGLRNGPAYTMSQQSSLKRLPSDWNHLVLSQSEWGPVRFAKGLLFSENDLERVRKKISRPGWKEHFKIMHEHARACLQRDPENDIGNTISSGNIRISRASEQGRVPYYWDSLTLAFVGLVKKDPKYLQHALRYLCCMLDSPRWVESGECAVSTSTWNYRAFAAEMTTTSVVLLGDWLDFTLPAHSRSLLRHAIWDRGVSPVLSNLLKYSYMSQMNQGAVFSRAVVLGALFLEDQWNVSKIADDGYAYMLSVLERYIKPDGFCSEGPTYLCQTLQGVLSPLIAYARMRERDWQKDVSAAVGRGVSYLETVSSGFPGRVTPVNDSRTTWLSGDGVPIIAGIDSRSSMNGILYNCLVNGQIFRSSGTLTNSGGILGLVYGPENVESPRSIRPEYEFLEQGQIVSCARSQGDSVIGLLAMGAGPVAGHTHLDKGQFVIDVDSDPILVDPGMVRYSATDAIFLQKSCRHNVLTPVLENGSYQDQVFSETKGEIKSERSDNQLFISMELGFAWPGYFKAYKREIVSKSPTIFSINDSGRNCKKFSVAFHVQIPFEPEILEKSIVVNSGKCNFIIDAKWCSLVRIAAIYNGSAADKIYHVAFESNAINEFSFTTVVTIKL